MGVHNQPDVLSVVSMIRGGQHYVQEVGGVLLIAVRRWQRDDVGSLAAAVAYYLALSLFPLILLLTAGVGIVMRFSKLGQDAQTQILAVCAEHCSPSLEAQVKVVLEQFQDQSTTSGPLGLATAILAAIGVFYQFERAFDKIWRIPPPPSRGILRTLGRLLTQRLAAFALLAGVGLAIVLVLVANIAIGAVREWMTSLRVPGTVMVTIVDASTTMLLNAFAFGVLYRWLPKRPVLWQDAFRGGLLVSIIWEIGRQLLSAFLIGNRYATAYGAIGAFIALLLWFYWGVTILLFGAEYVLVLSRRHGKPLTMFSQSASPTSDADASEVEIVREFVKLRQPAQQPRRAAA